MRSAPLAARGLLSLLKAQPFRSQGCFANATRARRQLHLSSISQAVTLTAESLSSIHSAGVPWLVTIPLFAVGVNFAFRLPIQYYSRQLLLKRKELDPLVQAWAVRHRIKTSIRDEPNAEIRWRLRVSGLIGQSRARIYKSWGCQRWKSGVVLLNMIPLIAISEALRRLSGAPLGFMTRYFGIGSTDSGPLSIAAAWVDQSLADGGALWFTDLTAADPYGALPTFCAFLLAYQIKQNMSFEQLRKLFTFGPNNAGLTFADRAQQVVGRLILSTPFLPIIFWDLPSAIFVYWASSFGLNILNTHILKRLSAEPDPKLKFLASPSRPLNRRFLRGTK